MAHVLVPYAYATSKRRRSDVAQPAAILLISEKLDCGGSLVCMVSKISFTQSYT